MMQFKSFFATGIIIVSCNISRAKAGAFTPTDAAFFNNLEEIQQTLSAKSKTLNHNSPCSLSKLCTPGTQSRSDVYQKVILRLADSPVPASYVSSALYDPRTRIIPEIPPLFQRHGGHGEEIPYERYRKLFLTPKNIAAGAQFYIKHKDLLTQVQNRYGVDPFVLISLLGIETRWGQDTGKIPVLSALYTIATSVPRLSDWACQELAAYFEICYGEKIPPHSILGSYAGAFGYYQFMPSSYNLYAVDFDADGKKSYDTWPDVLASVANYLTAHGYKPSGGDGPDSPIWQSLYSYNHSNNYAHVILEFRAAIKAAIEESTLINHPHSYYWHP